MTKTERRKFYNKLREIKNHFTWKMTRDEKIRAVLNGAYYCPLTAISKVEVGKRTPISDVFYAPIISLNIDEDAIDIIAKAADLVDENPSAESRAIRSTMMRIVGLS